jgi:hypothetical protein
MLCRAQVIDRISKGSPSPYSYLELLQKFSWCRLILKRNYLCTEYPIKSSKIFGQQAIDQTGSNFVQTIRVFDNKF